MTLQKVALDSKMAAEYYEGQMDTEFLDEDEVKPVVAQKEEKSTNCYTFTVQNEDHTLGNMLTDQLLQENGIRFAGYRIEHPTKDIIKIRVQSENSINQPSELVDKAITDLLTKIEYLRDSFESAAKSYNDKNVPK